MDVADEIRRQEREHQEVLQGLQSSTRERVKALLVRMYEELDESIDPALLDRAIDTFVAEQHRFHQPNGGVELTLAGWYVRRRELGRRYGLPLLAIGTLAFAAWVALGLQSWAGLRAEERRVEGSVETLHRRNSKVTASGCSIFIA